MLHLLRDLIIDLRDAAALAVFASVLLTLCAVAIG